jgi:hypothetical protein
MVGRDSMRGRARTRPAGESNTISSSRFGRSRWRSSAIVVTAIVPWPHIVL